MLGKGGEAEAAPSLLVLAVVTENQDGKGKGS
jgi:hypothetical protein